MGDTTVPKEGHMKLDEVGLYKGKYKGWMETFTGKRVNPLELRPEDVDIVDIAHALSQICRYGGHCHKFYSVAEHCIRVAVKAPDELKLAALLHDAEEAYLGDVIRPLKYCFPMLVEAGLQAQYIIYKAFNVSIDDVGINAIKVLDNVLIATEARDLMVNSANWNGLPPPLPETITPIPQHQAKDIFLAKFKEYYS